MSRRMARIHVSSELLCQVLGIPEDTTLVAATMDITTNGNLCLLVEHEELKPIPEGDAVPLLAPVVEKVPDGIVWDWNQD